MIRFALIEQKCAPRSSLLRGTWEEESRRGQYIVTIPPVAHYPSRAFGPITGSCRIDALYRWASRGGFTLPTNHAGLTVWTVEEWEAIQRLPGAPQVALEGQ